MPDFVANAYLDQAWGALYGSVIVHNLTASYFNAHRGFGTGANTTNSYLNGHPADAWAFGLVGGIQIKNIPTGVGDMVYVDRDLRRRHAHRFLGSADRQRPHRSAWL